MNNEQRDFVTTQEVAEILGKSLPTVYKYIKDKKINPIYDHKWRMRRTKLFDKQEIEQFKESITKPGITTFKVSKKYDIPYHVLMKYIHESKLPAIKRSFQGKVQYFLQENDIKQFLESKEWQQYKKKNTNLLSNDKYFLFQSFYNEESQDFGRIMEMEQDPKLSTINNKTIPLEVALYSGYTPKYIANKKDHINRKGYAKFKFVRPYDLQSIVYQIIEKFLVYLGPSNMKMEFDKDNILMEVKPSLITVFTEEEINYLMEALVSGEIFEDIEGIYIDTGLEPMTIYFSNEMKDFIRKKAADDKCTMEELIIHTLKQHWNIT
ncbi:helix-turn-helix domain-containing protein (plasmid) [Rossellomorea marisflavi]|uniref:helix-turn-helix domain-containing protein n=1 Tax=Rossellomorea marisflavi TaxID=189381 RepID=UPI0013197185|nr:helix-turn-helix domain-containing protein [Rossellomorea marisflavi]QHA38664.1 helix-turn-helix domain-containing protein [Rossellomorea marisflavi]